MNTDYNTVIAEIVDILSDFYSDMDEIYTLDNSLKNRSKRANSLYKRMQNQVDIIYAYYSGYNAGRLAIGILEMALKNYVEPTVKSKKYSYYDDYIINARIIDNLICTLKISIGCNV